MQNTETAIDRCSTEVAILQKNLICITAFLEMCSKSLKSKLEEVHF